MSAECLIDCPTSDWCMELRAKRDHINETLHAEDGPIDTLAVMQAQFDILPKPEENAELSVTELVKIEDSRQTLEKSQKAVEATVEFAAGLTELIEKTDPGEIADECDGPRVEDDPIDPTQLRIYCGSRAISEEQRQVVFKSKPREVS